jgi:hypothetical protein
MDLEVQTDTTPVTASQTHSRVSTLALGNPNPNPNPNERAFFLRNSLKIGERNSKE